MSYYNPTNESDSATTTQTSDTDTVTPTPRYTLARGILDDEETDEAVQTVIDLVGHMNWYISDNEESGANAFSPLWLKCVSFQDTMIEDNVDAYVDLRSIILEYSGDGFEKGDLFNALDSSDVTHAFSFASDILRSDWKMVKFAAKYGLYVPDADLPDASDDEGDADNEGDA